MRKIKHILNVAFVAATTTIATTISCLCSCKYENNVEEEKLQTINIGLKENDFSIQEYRTVTSPIDVECLNNKGEPIQADLDWVIVEDDGKTIPKWIEVDENNQLIITANAEISQYKFNIFAQDKETKTIKSEVKTFNVEIHGSPLVPPESIEIINEGDKNFIFLRDQGTIHLKTIGHREGFQPSEVSSECKWTINNISGKKTRDLMGAYTFSIKYDENGCDLIMSQYVDSSYEGQYSVTISAESLLSKYVTAYIRIDFNVCNGTKYTDWGSGCILTRKNIHEAWTISSLVSGTTIVAGLPDLVYDYPITKVGKNLCSVSGITGLTEVTLPSSVVEIEQSAFADQSELARIVMPGVKYIGDEAFKNCAKLVLDTNYDQPILRYVGAKAFYFCSKFTLVSANELYYIGEYAFCSTAIKSINIGPYITFIDTDPFTSCASLEEIIISNEIPPKLGGALFYGSTNPQRIKVPMTSLDTYLSSPDWAPYVDLIVGF